MQKTLKFFRYLSWFFLTVFVIYFFLLGGWKDAITGRMHRKAFELFSFTHGVSKVEVFLLSGKESSKTMATFPIRPYRKTETIYGSITLTGDDLEEFLKLWSYQELNYMNQAMCHHPPYGFRLYKGTRQIGETSVCWHCNNFYINVYPGISTWYGFNAESPEAKKLLEFCDRRLPYKKRIPESSD